MGSKGLHGFPSSAVAPVGRIYESYSPRVLSLSSIHTLNMLSSGLCYFPPETHSSHLFCCTPEVEVWKVHYRKMQKDELSAELGQCLRQPDYSNSPFQGQRREAVSLEK